MKLIHFLILTIFLGTASSVFAFSWFGQGPNLAPDDYQGAEKYYGAQAQKDPKDTNANFLWGNALYRLGRYPEAESAYARVLQAKPDMEQAWYNLGNALYQQQRYSDAVAAYQKALQLKPKDKDAQHNLELAQKKIEKDPKSDQSQKADQKNPGNGFNSLKQTPGPTPKPQVTARPTESSTVTMVPTPDRDADPNQKSNDKAKETARGKSDKNKYNSDDAKTSQNDPNAKKSQSNQGQSGQQPQTSQNSNNPAAAPTADPRAQQRAEDQQRQQQAKQQLGLSDSQVQALINQLQKQEAGTQQYYSPDPKKDLKRQEDAMNMIPQEQRDFLKHFFGVAPDKGNEVEEDW